MIRILALILLALTPSAAAAQPQQRSLDVPAQSTWEHAETGLRLPPVLAGTSRGRIQDSGTAELDVNAAYSAPAEGLVVTVYVYRTGLPDAALWFDRSLGMLQLVRAGETPRPDVALPNTDTPVITPFALGSNQTAGLLTAVDTSAGGQRSTGLMVAQVGTNWLLKVRMSSTQVDAAALRARLESFAGAIAFAPGRAPAAGERAASPIQPCATPLRLRRARVPEADLTESIMAGLTANLIVRQLDRAGSYCREPGATVMGGTYRHNGSETDYVIALFDSGLAVVLTPATSLDDLQRGSTSSARGRYSMALVDRQNVAVWPSLDRLPPPQQALELLRTSRPVLSVGFGNRGAPPQDGGQSPK